MFCSKEKEIKWITYENQNDIRKNIKYVYKGEVFMYPIRFESIYHEKIWGGRDFEIFRSNLPAGNIGESWDIACHRNGTGIVANGKLKGKSFEEIILEFGHALVGKKVSTEKFPIMVKLINSKEKLSVQVHPGDEYAKEVENEFGKTEAWYVIEAEPGAKIIIGTKNCNKETFARAVKEGKVEEYLNVVDVKKGDAFLINSGLVHAIGKGLIIAEIQENSDVTYRVYDYGRPRELQVEKSLAVMDFNLQAKNLSSKEIINFEGFSKVDLCENQYFGLQKIIIKNQWQDYSSKEAFFILTCVDGTGVIESSGFLEKIKIGDSYLIPATLGQYKLKGKLEVIKTYPN